MIAVRRSRKLALPCVTNPGRRLLLAAAAGCLLPRAATAVVVDEHYPNRPIRLILPSAAGGSSDLLGRLLAQPLGEALGVPIVVDPRPGAAGRIALDLAADAAPDGYTLLLANNGSNAIAPGARGTHGKELGRAFAPVTRLTRLPIVIAVNPALGVTSLPELIARARRAPGQLSYASSDLGSTSHMAADLLFRRAGVSLLHVPYNGTATAVRDVLSGVVPVLFTHLGTVAALVRDGRLCALAVSGRRRMAEFPDVPTVAEAGYPGYDITTWHGVMLPAGAPRAVISRLHDELTRVTALPGLRRQLAAMGMEVEANTPEQFAAEIEADVRHWAELLRTTGRAQE
ncbi:MAG: tripartite tricarboxylate transporter substrate binding protein [Betaproteobacteria bacterium]|nr:tripartite tricarboxylate transporter substrate binding protein [Betaproteobacteria bacterium]